MTFTAEIRVRRSLPETWAFLADPSNAPKWDRSIASTRASPGPIGVGTEVETTAPSGMRQAFRIARLDAPHRLTFVLLESSLFRRAELSFTLAEEAGRTRITHTLELALRPAALLFAPILRWTQRKALATDLEYLRRALDEGFVLGA